MRVQIVGRGHGGPGRMAAALHAALTGAGELPGGIELLPIAGRGADGRDPDGETVDVVLLAVPDAAIAEAAAGIVPGPLLGHCSGAATLDVLGRRERFSLHPLTSVTGAGSRFSGASAAVDGSTERALAVAHGLAAALGMRASRVRDEDRAAYHAAASIASNFLVTLEGFATRLAATAGVPREALVPLVRQSVENWAAQGAASALTGPIVRGDAETVARQRAAVADRAPRELRLFDALVEATERLAGRTAEEGSA